MSHTSRSFSLAGAFGRFLRDWKPLGAIYALVISISALLFLATLVSCGAYVGPMDINNATPVIRTDFSDEAAWNKIKIEVAGRYSMGFSANVRFIDDMRYSGLTGQELFHRFPRLQEYGCIFVADEMTMTDLEHPLLVIDPYNPSGRTFRVIPSLAWAVENNLSISNMDYNEFSDAADPDGILRGFK